MARSVDRRPLFLEPADYRFYETLLLREARRLMVRLHSFCPMTNHVHQLVENQEPRLPRLVQSVHGTYARWYNQKYGRKGHLFEDRYKSKVILDSKYLLEVFRYIHTNPVRAGLCRSASDYPYGSFRGYLEPGSMAGLTTELLQRPFEGPDYRKNLLDFTMARIVPENGRDGWPVVDWYASDDGDDWTSNADPSPSLEPAGTVLERVACAFGCAAVDLSSQKNSPGLGPARAAAALLLDMRTPLSQEQIGLLVGYSSPFALNRAIRAAIERSDREPHLRRLWRELGLPS